MPFCFANGTFKALGGKPTSDVQGAGEPSTGVGGGGFSFGPCDTTDGGPAFAMRCETPHNAPTSELLPAFASCCGGGRAPFKDMLGGGALCFALTPPNPGAMSGELIVGPRLAPGLDNIERTIYKRW